MKMARDGKGEKGRERKRKERKRVEQIAENLRKYTNIAR